MTDTKKRHRWALFGSHYHGSGSQSFRCVKCGLHKVTEYECQPTYTLNDGHTYHRWKRFAPPCPAWLLSNADEGK